MKKISFTKNPAPANTMFSSETASERNSESLFLYLVYGTEFLVVFYSAEWFGTELREFASNFCSLVQNYEHFSPLRNGSERNSASFLFRGTAGIPPEQTICSVFRGIIFCRKSQTLI
jgi:hypothetical protein